MWLVSRVPTSTTQVRRGDIARVMAFAVENATAAEEVVEVLVGNVVRPLAFQKHILEASSASSGVDRDGGSVDVSKKEEKEREREKETDTSGAKIVALYLLSDVLSNSSLGVRNAWRYRGLVEQKLREAKVMESLGKTYRSESWGRIRREKFRRLVVGVLGLWENWNVFPQGTHEEFMRIFMEGGREDREGSEKKEEKEKEEVTQQGKTKSRWKTVDTSTEPVVPAQALLLQQPKVEDEEMADGEDEDLDGVPMEEEDDDDDDDDLDGVPLEDDDDGFDGVPMADEDEEEYGRELTEKAKDETESHTIQPEETKKEESMKMGFGGMTFGVRAVGMGVGPPVKRKRPKAEDMFADDDDED